MVIATTMTITIIDRTFDKMGSFTFFSDKIWLRALARDAFGKDFWGFLIAAIGFGLLCFWIKGIETTLDTLGGDIEMLLKFLPRIVLALSIAALIWVMLPRDRVSALVGQNTGIKGLVIASMSGAVTPGGPSSAYALLAVLGASGADRGAMVAYITAWATLGLQRVLIWDVPFMGSEFAILRILVSLPLPILAGLIARQLPFELILRDPLPAKSTKSKE